MLSSRLLPADIVRRVAASGASVVVISNLPPGGLPQTAYLSRLLRRKHPDLTIIVARWGGRSDYDEQLVRARKAGASYLTTTLGQTVAQLLAAAAPASSEAPSPSEPLDPLVPAPSPVS